MAERERSRAWNYVAPAILLCVVAWVCFAWGYVLDKVTRAAKEDGDARGYEQAKTPDRGVSRGWAGEILVKLLESESPSPGDDGTQLERWGQSGDAFGSLNALFTGLAFAFVAYTAYLQTQEMKDSRKEARHQRKDQLLSAKLNATAALFNTYAVDEGMAPEASGGVLADSVLLEARRVDLYQKRKLRRAIGSLLHEARIGFYEDEYDPRIEERAMRSYLAEFLRDILGESLRTNDLPYDYAHGYGMRALMEIGSLKQQFALSHPGLAGPLNQMFNDFAIRCARRLSDSPVERMGAGWTIEDKRRQEDLIRQMVEFLGDPASSPDSPWPGFTDSPPVPPHAT